MKIYIVLRYNREKHCKVVKTYLLRSDADKAKERLNERYRGCFTHHVISKSILGK